MLQWLVATMGPKRKRACLDGLEHCQYVIANGLRFVKPYFFVHEAYAKGRWYGRTVMEIFTKEFGTMPEGYFVSCRRDCSLTCA